jgi:hypothetical protein
VDCNEAESFYDLNDKIGDSEAVFEVEGFGAKQSQGLRTAFTQTGGVSQGSKQQPNLGTPSTQKPQTLLSSRQESLQDSNERNYQGGFKGNPRSRPSGDQTLASSFEDIGAHEDVSSDDFLAHNQNNIKEKGIRNQEGKGNKSGESKLPEKISPKQKGQGSKPDKTIISPQNEGNNTPPKIIYLKKVANSMNR